MQSAGDEAAKATSLTGQKRHLYHLIVDQLRRDGFDTAAQFVSSAALIPINPTPLKRSRALEALMEPRETPTTALPVDTPATLATPSAKPMLTRPDVMIDYEKNPKPEGPTNVSLTTSFIVTHKDSVRTAKFSPDGALVVTGSTDTTIKLIDVARMKLFNDTTGGGRRHVSKEQTRQPVLCTYYGHTGSVTDLDFHPRAPVLASCCKHGMIKLWDHRSTNRFSFHELADDTSLLSLHFHPSGDYLATAGASALVRVYDVEKGLAPYVSRVPREQQHSAPVTQVRWSSDGRTYVTCSKDGSIKVWDGVTSSLVRTMESAHGDGPVHSARITRAGKNILSVGNDGRMVLWDVGTGTPVVTYAAPRNVHRFQATLNYREDLLLSSDETRRSLVLWNVQGDMLGRLTGHNGPIKWVEASPVEDAFISCSKDNRARFWIANEV